MGIKDEAAKLEERLKLMEPVERACATCGTAFEIKWDSDRECPGCIAEAKRVAEKARLVAAEADRREKWPETLAAAGVPKRYWPTQKVALPPGTEGWRGEPWALTLLGQVGCGKTFAATRIFGELICSGTAGLWVSTAAALDSLRMSIKTGDDSGLFERMMKARLLLLDDYMAERATDFAVERLSLLLTHRYDHELPTIITTNSVSEERGKTFPGLGSIARREARIASRLLTGRVVVVEGNDRRFGR